jgi:hypothetical protein
MQTRISRRGRDAEAIPHWQAYLLHDPSSQWAHYARCQLGGERHA